MKMCYFDDALEEFNRVVKFKLKEKVKVVDLRPSLHPNISRKYLKKVGTISDIRFEKVPSLSTVRNEYLAIYKVSFSSAQLGDEEFLSCELEKF